MKKLTAYEKARAYCKYCNDHDYTLRICFANDESAYIVITAGGFEHVGDWDGLKGWLAQRYDDEKEAGNIE